MYEFIRGHVAANHNTSVVIDNQGIGYHIRCSLVTSAQIPLAGSATLYIHQHVSQDQVQLFGFATKDERDLFRLLIAISGVGPKIALAILSGMSSDDLVQAVHQGDLARFESVPGVGKMTAKRLLLELEKKLGSFQSRVRPDRSQTVHWQEALTALETLGFSRRQVEQPLRDLYRSTPDLTVEDAVRRLLQNHGKQK